MTTLCGSCGAPTPDGATLCTGCTRHLRTALRELPNLLDELDTTTTRSATMPTTNTGTQPCTHTGDCGCGVTLPWNDHAANTAHNLRQAIRHWAHTAGTPPTPTHLANALPTIRQQPWAPHMHTDITHHRNQAERAIDNPEQRLYAGPCGALHPIHTLAPCPHRIWARPEQTTITCPNCGTIHNIADRQTYMLNAAANMHMTAPAIASALTLMTRTRIPTATIRQWDARGQLTPTALDPNGRKLYRFGDVHTLWTRSRQETLTA